MGDDEMENERFEQLASLFDTISALERKMANEWNSRNHLGFSKSHVLILELLATEGPKRPSYIADKLKITTGGVTVLTTKLVKGGYIERTQNELDKRAAQISITDVGLQVLEQSRTHIQHLIDDLFGMLSDEEIRTLKQIFMKCL